MDIFARDFDLEFKSFCWWVVILALIASAILLLGKLMNRDQPSATFRTFTYNPYKTGDPIRKKSATVFVQELITAQTVPTLTISQKLRKIDWFQFEKLMELIYRQRGFTVTRLGGANPDGGVDLIVKSPSETFAVQCKQWRKWTVGVKEIREFLGALTDSGIQKGIFVTLGGLLGCGQTVGYQTWNSNFKRIRHSSNVGKNLN